MGLFLDGKAFADDEIVIAVGITMAGNEIMLGLIQTASENTAVCRDFLSRWSSEDFVSIRGCTACLMEPRGFIELSRRCSRGAW